MRLGLDVKCVEFHRLPCVKILLKLRTEFVLLPCCSEFFFSSVFDTLIGHVQSSHVSFMVFWVNSALA